MGKRIGIMLPYPFEEARLARIGFPCYVQPKLDGVRARFIQRDKDSFDLLSSQGNPITQLPRLLQTLKSLRLKPGTELDGELYVHGWSFERIFSVTSRTVDVHPLANEMEYHIFDMPSAEGGYHDRLTQILGLPIPSEYPGMGIYRVENFYAYSMEDISNLVDMFVKMGYEGVIIKQRDLPYIRCRTPKMLKIKPDKSDVYTITQVVPEVSQDGVVKERVGAFVVKDDDSNIFSVGTGPLLTWDNRVQLWSIRHSLIGKKITVKYQQLTDRGVPRFPVALHITLGGDEQSKSRKEALL